MGVFGFNLVNVGGFLFCSFEVQSFQFSCGFGGFFKNWVKFCILKVDGVFGFLFVNFGGFLLCFIF